MGTITDNVYFGAHRAGPPGSLRGHKGSFDDESTGFGPLARDAITAAADAQDFDAFKTAVGEACGESWVDSLPEGMLESMMWGLSWWRA